MADKTGITITHVELPHVVAALKAYDRDLERAVATLPDGPRWNEVYEARRSIMRVLRRMGEE